MLLGEYHHNLDPKGRMAIPVKFREKLISGAIVTRGLEWTQNAYHAAQPQRSG